MTTSAEILALVAAALRTPVEDVSPATYPTDAGKRVFGPGDIPTQDDQWPLLKLRLVSESRQAQGRGTVGFTTLCTVRVNSEVSAPAKMGDVATSTAEAQLWTLKRQVEIAIINSYPLFRVIQQLASVQSQFAYTSEAATHLAGMQIDLVFEFYEGSDSFAPIDADDLAEVDADFPGFPGLHAATSLA